MISGDAALGVEFILSQRFCGVFAMIQKPLKVARLLKVAFVILGVVLVCLSVLLRS